MSLAKAPSIFFFCNVGWFFLSHRLALAQAAKAQGYDVHVVCDIDSLKEVEAIEAASFKFHRIRLSRGGLNPFAELRTSISILALFLKYRPSIAHNISIKPVLYGSIAARIARLDGVVNAISGLGYVFVDTERSRIVRKIVHWVYRIALQPRTVRVIFQNEADRQHFVNSGLVCADQAVLIAGSGVDLAQYRAAPEPSGSMIRIVLPARMLADKGINEFVAAAKLLKRENLPVECLLAGTLDDSNPAALSLSDLRALERDGDVKWLGHVSDMPRLLQNSQIVCLPSYREGLPKALIEACAASRPIVTTSVPGCCDVVRDGVNGLLVPPRKVKELADALGKLVRDRDLRAAMGARGREIAENEYGVERVIESTLRLYDVLLEKRPESKGCE